MTAIIIAAFVLTVFLFLTFNPAFGSSAKGEGKTRIENSPNYHDGKFHNLEGSAPLMDMSFVSSIKAIKQMIAGVPNDRPSATIPTHKFDKQAFLEPDTCIKIVWFGHSTVLMNIDGKIILTDPMFSKYASPVQFTGIKRYSYSNYITVEELPEIDLVLISHDHFDHLDTRTIKQLKDKAKMFFMPLGVSAHLLSWGVSPEKIREIDWHDSLQLNKDYTFIATPNQHFSGRGIGDRNETLWCSWVINTPNHKLFFSGDGGYGKHFKQIGDKYGPFDFAMLECGQYNERWSAMHSMPDKTAQAHIDLQAKVMLPIHWGKFKLSLHTWVDPIEKILFEGKKRNITIATPEIGEVYQIKRELPINYWWRKVKQ